MAVVYFDIEKAYDSMWREGLLIKLSKMGIGRRLYNWIMDFLTGRKFRVKVGAEVSKDFEIENGTPQESANSPIPFNIMINYIFTSSDGCIRSAPYADDGAIWMRGRNVPYVLENIGKAIQKVEQWSYDWEFKLSTSKSCYMLFTKKSKLDAERITLYGQSMERVSEFKVIISKIFS